MSPVSPSEIPCSVERCTTLTSSLYEVSMEVDDRPERLFLCTECAGRIGTGHLLEEVKIHVDPSEHSLGTDIPYSWERGE